MVSLVQRLRFVILFSLSAALAVASLPIVALAQQSENHVSQSNGRTLEWSDDWELNTSIYEEDLQFDRVMLQGVDQVVMLNVVFMADTFNRTEVRDALLDNLKTDGSEYNLIDSGDYNNLSYELSAFELDGVEVGSFILVFTNDGTTALHIIAPIDDFSDGVLLAQSTVTLDGSETFEGIDGSSLETQLHERSVSPSNSTETRQPANTSSSSSNTRSETTFTSQTWGYSVSYPTGWNSDPSLGIGELDLASSGLNAIVSFQGIDNPGLSGATLEMALFDTFASTVGGPGNVISTASNSGGAVFVGSSDGIIMVQELVILSPSVVIIVTAVIIGDYDSSVNQLQEIAINGKRILSLL